MKFRTCLACALLVATSLTGGTPQPRDRFRDAFTEIHRTVAERFFDFQLNGLDWNAVGETFGQRAEAADSLEDYAQIINDMLALLNASHTYLCTARDPAYFQLRSIFESDELQYPGIGIFTTAIEGEVFISGILDGTPAADAGLCVGDRIVSVSGAPFHPIGSFEQQVGKKISVVVQRTERPSEFISIEVVPVLHQPRAMFVAAIRNSVRMIERPSARIGYIRMWSYAGEPYRQALKESLLSAPLRDADALILNLRDGWGGANPDDINLFNDCVPELTFIGRDGQQRTLAQSWHKPLVLLVNEGTRSGKEVLAHACQKHGIATIVGTRTAGAVLGGAPFPIGSDMLLYLATADIRVDGDRLEGVGVKPDVEVKFDIRYSQGQDPQLNAAVMWLTR